LVGQTLKKLKIALVWPQGFDRHYVIPLALGYLKSNADPELFDIRIIDCVLLGLDARSEKLKAIIQDFSPDIVGVSSWSPMFNEALSILKLAKFINPDIVTVIGGAHASSYPQKVMAHLEIDFLMRGEAELSFPALLAHVQQGSSSFDDVNGLVYRNANGELLENPLEYLEDLDLIKYPDYLAIQLEAYIAHGYKWNSPENRNAPIWVTRGCPYRCTFCAAPELNGRPIRTHSVEYMVDWIQHLYDEYGILWFNIIDDNFTFNWRYATRFCETFIDLGLEGVGFGTPNGIRLQKGSPELWQLMKKAGWRSLNVAPESGSQRVLDIMKKDLDLRIVPEIVKDIRAAGLKVQAYFIIGYPGEEIEDLLETEKFIHTCRFNFVFLNNFQPLPGTPVYDDLVRKGEIKDGLLPENYSDGVRAYTPVEFAEFNFPKFILRTYLQMVIKDPLNLPYMLSFFPPALLVEKVISNVIAMFRGGGYVPPPRTVDQPTSPASDIS
jgi:anaerobic magnesium-protoporphyrin IX monomethyl ester cyclase